MSFYQEVVGLEMVNDARDRGYVFLVDPLLWGDGSRSGPMLEIVDANMFKREAGLVRKFGACLNDISFLVEDVDIAFEELVSKGVELEVEPMDIGPTRVTFVKDPNGVSIELELSIWDEQITAWRKCW